MPSKKRVSKDPLFRFMKSKRDFKNIAGLIDLDITGTILYEEHQSDRCWASA